MSVHYRFNCFWKYGYEARFTSECAEAAEKAWLILRSYCDTEPAGCRAICINASSTAMILQIKGQVKHCMF